MKGVVVTYEQGDLKHDELHHNHERGEHHPHQQLSRVLLQFRKEIESCYISYS